MRVDVRKITYEVHLDALDGSGNVVQEITIQHPLTLYAHQLDALASEVELVRARAEQQFTQAEVEEGG